MHSWGPGGIRGWLNCGTQRINRVVVQCMNTFDRATSRIECLRRVWFRVCSTRSTHHRGPFPSLCPRFLTAIPPWHTPPKPRNSARWHTMRTRPPNSLTQIYLWEYILRFEHENRPVLRKRPSGPKTINEVDPPLATRNRGVASR